MLAYTMHSLLFDRPLCCENEFQTKMEMDKRRWLALHTERRRLCL